MGQNINIDFGNSSEVFYYTTALSFKRLPFYMISWGNAFAGPKYFAEFSGHDGFLLLCTTEGSGFLKYRSTHKNILAGDVFYINCNEYHHYGTSQEGFWNFKWIYIDGDGCKGYFDLINEQGLNIIRPENKVYIDKLILEIHNIMSTSDFQRDIKIASVISSILTGLLLSTQKPLSSAPYQKADAVSTALEYIEKNYYKSLSLEEISSVIHFSPFYFSRIFKEYTGMAPYEYLMKYRIEVGKKLLKQTDQSIAVIAEKAGFPNTNNFIRYFKKLTGITPHQFRLRVMN